MSETYPNDTHLPEEAPPQQQPQRVRVQFPTGTPWVTYTILGLTILVFLAQTASNFFLGGDLPAALGMKINERIIHGELWRLFTPMLLHGGLLHIGFNMYALYVIGPSLERTFGGRRFLLLYLVSGFAGNVFSFIFTSANSLGASTAIFGIFGAQGIFIYQNRKLFGERSRAMLNQIILLAAINLVIGLQANIDNWGHVGGLIGGVAFAWFAGPILKVEGIAPDLHLKDQRQEGADLLSSLGVGLIFAMLALVEITLR